MERATRSADVVTVADNESDDGFPKVLATHYTKKQGIKARHHTKKEGIKAKCKHCPISKQPISGNKDKGGNPVRSNLTRHLKVRKHYTF